jgi:hypothetical protein
VEVLLNPGAGNDAEWVRFEDFIDERFRLEFVKEFKRILATRTRGTKGTNGGTETSTQNGGTETSALGSSRK